MKVFILTEGGKNIGFGHVTRCIALCQAFKERNIVVKLIINADDSVKVLLKKKHHIILDWLKEREKVFDLIDDKDMVIIDSYLADLDFYQQVASLVKTPVFIDDNKRLNYPKGIIINGNTYGREISYPVSQEKKYLLGSKYHFLRKEFWKVPKKKINKGVKNVLITFGGMVFSSKLYRVIDYLKNKFDLSFHIVDPTKKKIAAKEMLNLILKADICIAGGGQTLYELARVGVPTVTVAIGKDQLRNAKGLQKEGFIEYAGWWQNTGIDTEIKNGFKKLLPKSVRLKRARLGRTVIDGKGTMRIVSQLISYYEKF